MVFELMKGKIDKALEMVVEVNALYEDARERSQRNSSSYSQVLKQMVELDKKHAKEKAEWHEREEKLIKAAKLEVVTKGEGA